MKPAILLAATALAAVLAGQAEARDLTVVSWGGPYQKAQREVYFDPFTAATGITVAEDSWDGGIGVLRTKLQSGANTWIWCRWKARRSCWAARRACSRNWIGRRSAGATTIWRRASPIAASAPSNTISCCPGTATSSRARRPGRISGTWRNYPGKRALRRGVKTNLEFALLADGVAPGDVYRLLRTEDGVNRAFLKLDQLKPYLGWWQLSPQAAQLLGTGEVLMTSAVNGRITAIDRTEHRNFGIQWTGSLSTVDYWTILRGSPNKADALKFLNFAGNPAIEAKMTPIIPYGGLAKGAADGLAPDVLATSPTNPAHLSVSLTIDDQFWRDNLDKLSKRFDAWIAR